MKVKLKQIIDELTDAINLPKGQKVAALVDSGKVVGWIIFNNYNNKDSMTTEQKAKRYDEVVNEIKNLHDNLLKEGVINENGIICDNFNRIFPELKESEDERIRNEIIKFLELPHPQFVGKRKHKDWIAWLEKQGESKPHWKPTEEQYEALAYAYNSCSDSERSNYYEGVLESLIEDLHRLDEQHPKFHVGDWIASFDYFEPIQVVGIRTREYELSSGMIDPIYMVDNNPDLRLWTINDAKEGDVLLSPSTPEGDKECPFIFKEVDKNGIVRYHAALLQSEELKIADGITNVMGYANAGYHTPATKEQRRLLFQKMKEAGYMWDAEKKQCEQKPVENAETKFKDGDWIVYRDGVWKVCNIGLQNYYDLLKTNNEVGIRLIKDVDENAHLWTIDDAKDGDVLSYVTDEENLWIMIYWSLYKPYEGHVHYHALLVNDNFADKGTCCICIDNLKPATKEQRDLLFAKMEEAGYMWDSKKKELKKISA